MAAYLLLWFGLCVELPWSGRTLALLGLIHVMSRSLSAVSGTLLPVRPGEGTLNVFHQAADKRVAVLAVGWVVLSAAAMVAVWPLVGSVMALGAVVTLLLVRRMAMKQFEGMSGDIAGFQLQVAELVMLGLMVLMESAIAFGVTIPGVPFAGTMAMAMVFAFCSLLIILGLVYKLDFSLSTNTIILIGVIFSMFASSVMSIVITFSGEHLRSITFWTMGSLQGTSYTNVLVLLVALILFGGTILLHARELNAFAVGEENARHVGVNVRRVKLIILIAVSGLIGVCVSIGGTIGFVGLVTPHMGRAPAPRSGRARPPR